MIIECANPRIASQGLDEDQVGNVLTPVLSTLDWPMRLPIGKGDRILDVGGGHGFTGVLLSLRCPDAQVVTIEYQDQLADVAKGHQKRLKINNLSVVEGDALRFDLAGFTCIYMFHPFGDDQLRSFLNRVRNTGTQPKIVARSQNETVYEECGFEPEARPFRDSELLLYHVSRKAQ